MTVCLLCNHAPLTEHSLYADAASRSADLEAELQTKVILYMDEPDVQKFLLSIQFLQDDPYACLLHI